MDRQRPILLAVSLIAAGTWGIPHMVRACTCVLPPAPASAAEQADAVFEARVESVQGPGDASAPGMLRFELSVVRIFKGELAATAQLFTRASSASCGRNFIVGRRYLIYAGRNAEGALIDSLCSRTRQMSAADEDLAVLGPGVAPNATPPAPDHENREPPRIEAPPPLPVTPAPLDRRGCDLTDGPQLGLLALLFARRRRRRPS